jgi:hypothetical protein
MVPHPKVLLLFIEITARNSYKKHSSAACVIHRQNETKPFQFTVGNKGEYKVYKAQRHANFSLTQSITGDRIKEGYSIEGAGIN